MIDSFHSSILIPCVLTTPRAVSDGGSAVAIHSRGRCDIAAAVITDNTRDTD